MVDAWSDPERVAEYLAREIPHRHVAEELLLAALPPKVKRFLDLGTGDGRLLALIRSHHPEAVGVGVDSSPPMLDRARKRFAEGVPIELHQHDLADPLIITPPFDVVVSGLAIHHLEDDRKRALFAEVHDLLRPGGVFANLDLVTSATTALHERFRVAIGRAQDDPADRLAGLCEQLDWLRAAGFEEVDCHFKWLELALIVARRAQAPRPDA
jgi:tRNA (cmo5U34)-methyltransferase